MKYRDKIIKILAVLSVSYAMVCMWHWKMGLTYYTELSNLLVAAVVLLQLFFGTDRFKTVKFMAVTAVLTAGFAFLFAIAPMVEGGLIAAYAQDHFASLCLHGITPVLSLLDFLLYDTDRRWNLRQAPWCLIPPVIYFTGIVLMGAFGFRWYHGMSAPYPFLNYTAPAGWFGFMPETAGMTTFGIGVFYMILAFMGAVLLLGTGLLLAAGRIAERKEKA